MKAYGQCVKKCQKVERKCAGFPGLSEHGFSWWIALNFPPMTSSGRIKNPNIFSSMVYEIHRTELYAELLFLSMFYINL